MSVVTKSGTGTASGGTHIGCAWHRGCSERFYGSPFTNARGARQEARAEGWLVAQSGGRWADASGRTIRLDYCPEHADKERERRGLPIPNRTNRCPTCGVEVTGQTPSTFYLRHDETCGGPLEEPVTDRTNGSETFAERLARQSVEAMEAQKAADRLNGSDRVG